MRYPVFRAILSVLLGLVLLAVVAMNVTPGHFGYADDDGCSCVMSYTYQEARPPCEQSRLSQCDHIGVEYLLVLLARLDFNR